MENNRKKSEAGFTLLAALSLSLLLLLSLLALDAVRKAFDTSRGLRSNTLAVHFMLQEMAMEMVKGRDYYNLSHMDSTMVPCVPNVTFGAGFEFCMADTCLDGGRYCLDLGKTQLVVDAGINRLLPIDQSGPWYYARDQRFLKPESWLREISLAPSAWAAPPMGAGHKLDPGQPDPSYKILFVNNAHFPNVPGNISCTTPGNACFVIAMCVNANSCSEPARQQIMISDF